MFYDLPVLRRPLTTGVLLASALVLTTACGHKKSPIPPPSKVPHAVVVQAHQRGNEVVVSFLYPTVTISGTALPGISKVEIRQFGVEVPEFAVEILAQEAEQRKVAQQLLDDLGLPLYEYPVALPTLDADGNPIPGALPGEVPGAIPTTQGGFGTTDPMGQKTGEATPPVGEGFVNPVVDVGLQESEPPAAPVAADGGDPEDVDDEISDADGATDEDGENVAGDGSEENAEGELGEEIELTEEELLAIEVEKARGLLQSPPTPKSSFITATAKDFKQGSELVVSVEGDEITSALIGDRLVFRLPLPPRPVEGPEAEPSPLPEPMPEPVPETSDETESVEGLESSEESEPSGPPEIGYLYSVQVYALNGKASDPSAREAILPVDTPPAPEDMAVLAQADGIYLTWNADEDPASGFRIYRRDAQTRLYGEPLALLTLGTERYFLDRQAVFGARYIYGVTAVEAATPLLESDLSSEHEIYYQDNFGPATPSGLVAFPETGRVRLLWTAVPNLDVAGYVVSRRAAEEEQATRITDELVSRGQYLDESVNSGEVWFYSVVAVDTSGNRSEASVETQVRVP